MSKNKDKNSRKENKKVIVYLVIQLCYEEQVINPWINFNSLTSLIKFKIKIFL